MDNREKHISEVIQQALTEHGKLREYASYAPIYNSNLMLREMLNFVKTKLNPSDTEINKLNVGLLAAKALDFDNRFNEYATLLHNVWGNFLSFLNKSRAIPLLGDQRDAYDFYLRHGFNQDQILNHLDGIDFGIGKKIDTKYKLNQNDSVAQWKTLCIPQGNYYADKGKTPNCLGIHDRQEDYVGHVSVRIEHLFDLQAQIEVLKSVAESVLDTWSVKGHQFQTKGGCIQYFNANDKIQFKQVSP